MVKWLFAVPLVASQVAHAEPITVGVDAVFEVPVSAGWKANGGGLAVRRRVVRHLELGLEGDVLRIEPELHGDPIADDPRHGFAFRGAATLDYAFHTTSKRDRVITYWLAPELGIASSVLYGIDAAHHTADEVFVGTRWSLLVADDHDADAVGPAWGAHVVLRVGRSGGEYVARLLLGYEWRT